MNMTRKNVLLAALACGLAIPTWVQLKAEAEVFVDLGDVPRMFEGFTTDNVGAVLLAQPQAEQAATEGTEKLAIAYDQLLMVRTEAGWQVGQPERTSVRLAGAPVDASRLERDVFEHLRMIRNDPETLVQRNATPEQLAEYGLDEAHAFLVRAQDRSGRVVAELLVGADAGRGLSGTEAVRGVFVREANRNDVVLYEWERPWRRDVDANLWVDKTLWQLEPERVRKLSIRNTATDGKQFVFERGANRASFEAVEGAEDLGALRQSEIEGLVQRLRYIAVDTYDMRLTNAGDMSTYGLFPRAAISIRLELAEGAGGSGERRVVTLDIGADHAGSSGLYATSSESDFIFTLKRSLVAPLELDVAHRFFDPKPR